MSYQALYRKWRPRRFADMVGQRSTLTTLRNQIASGHIAHAYLFCGTRGTGKTSAAKIFSLAINCLDPQEGDACGVCAHCVALADPANMDIVEIDAASNNGVDEMRDLREKVKYPPSLGKYRVYIIDEVHMLSTGAFNALLKTLEEPPAHLVFILATTEAHKLPATILSRCQRYDFGRIALADIVGRLRQVLEDIHQEASEEALYAIARAAQGAMRDALSILDVVLGYAGEEAVTLQDVRDTLGLADESRLREYVDALLRCDGQSALTSLENMLRRGAQPAALLRDILDYLRALLLTATCGEHAPLLLEITNEEWEAYKEALKGKSEQSLLRLFDIFLPLSSDMRGASRPSYALEAATLRACFPQEEADLSALFARLDALEAAPPAKEEPSRAAPTPSKEPSAQKEPPARKEIPPEKPTATEPEGFDSKAIWNKVKTLLKKEQMSLYTMFSKGRLESMEPGHVCIAFEPQRNINKQVLEQPDKSALLEKAFATAAGMPMKVRFILAEQSLSIEKETPSATPDGIGRILDIFGRENVEIRED